MGERLRVIGAAYRAGTLPGEPRETQGVNLFENVDVLASTAGRLERATGLTQTDVARAVLEGLTEMKASGELKQIVNEQVRIAHRHLMGRHIQGRG